METTAINVTSTNLSLCDLTIVTPSVKWLVFSMLVGGETTYSECELRSFNPCIGRPRLAMSVMLDVSGYIDSVSPIGESPSSKAWNTYAMLRTNSFKQQAITNILAGLKQPEVEIGWICQPVERLLREPPIEMYPRYWIFFLGDPRMLLFLSSCPWRAGGTRTQRDRAAHSKDYWYSQVQKSFLR